MELRRPRLADKKAVIDMMEEFEKYQSPHDGWVSGIQRICDMKSGWKQICKKKWV